MREMSFIVLFAVVTSFVNVDTIYGGWIIHRFPHSNFQAQTPDQANEQDDYNKILPFPFLPFMDFFRPRILKPSGHMLNDVKNFTFQITTSGEKNVDTGDIKAVNTSLLKNGEEAVKFNALNSNDSFHSEINNLTGKITERILTTVPSHNIKKKVLETSLMVSFFDRIYHPLSRLNRFRYNHLNSSANQERNKTEDKDKESRKTPGIAHLKLNPTEAAMLNSSMLEEKRNCSNAHYILRYFLVWRISWASVILQVIFLILIGVLVSLGVYLCVVYSNSQLENIHTEKMEIVKTFTV